MLKFLSGLAVFAIACLLQFSFMPAGNTVNFVFATLVAFSFIFPARGGLASSRFARGEAPVDGNEGFLELFFFILAGVFLMNWIPAPTIALTAFAVLPVLAYFFGSTLPLEPLTRFIISLFLGFVILYFVTAPQLIIVAAPPFLMDLFAGSVFGFLVFLCMDRAFQ